jgi:hypothetical protein
MGKVVCPDQQSFFKGDEFQCPWAKDEDGIRELDNLNRFSEHCASKLLKKKGSVVTLTEDQRLKYDKEMDYYVQESPELFRVIPARMHICKSCNLLIGCINFENFQRFIKEIDNISLNASMEVEIEVDDEAEELPFDDNEDSSYEDGDYCDPEITQEDDEVGVVIGGPFTNVEENGKVYPAYKS